VTPDDLHAATVLPTDLSVEPPVPPVTPNADFLATVNKLSPLYEKPSLMIKAIDRLLIFDQPERQGFPFNIVMELKNLRGLYGFRRKAFGISASVVAATGPANSTH